MKSAYQAIEHIGVQLKGTEQLHTHIRSVQTEIISANNKTITYIENSSEDILNLLQIIINRLNHTEQLVTKEDLETKIENVLTNIHQTMKILVADSNTSWYSFIGLIIIGTLNLAFTGVYVGFRITKPALSCCGFCFDKIARGVRSCRNTEDLNQDSGSDVHKELNSLIKELAITIREAISDGQRQGVNFTANALTQQLSAFNRIGLVSTNQGDNVDRGNPFLQSDQLSAAPWHTQSGPSANSPEAPHQQNNSRIEVQAGVEVPRQRGRAPPPPGQHLADRSNAHDEVIFSTRLKPLHGLTLTQLKL